MVVRVVMEAVRFFWVKTRPRVWAAWMANSLAASIVSSKALMVEDYGLSPAM